MRPRTYPTRLGKQTPNHQNAQRMVQGPQARCRGRQCSKEGGNTPHPCLGHRQTPQNGQNSRPTEQKLLVARNEKLRHPIHQRVCTMPIAQKYHHTTQTSPIPHHNKPRSAAIRMHSAGLHHQITTVGRIRLHTDNNRPQLLEGIYIYPM